MCWKLFQKKAAHVELSSITSYSKCYKVRQKVMVFCETCSASSLLKSHAGMFPNVINEKKEKRKI